MSVIIKNHSGCVALSLARRRADALVLLRILNPPHDPALRICFVASRRQVSSLGFLLSFLSLCQRLLQAIWDLVQAVRTANGKHFNLNGGQTTPTRLHF